MIKTKRLVILLMAWLATSTLWAQDNAARLAQALEKATAGNTGGLQYPAQVKAFYQLYQYQPAFINQPSARQQLISYLDHAPEAGLRTTDYQYAFVQSFRNNTWPLHTKEDSAGADIRFTDAAIHFFTEIAIGNQAPETGYNGLNYHPACLVITASLANALSNNTFPGFLTNMESKAPDYRAVRYRITQYRKTISDSSFNSKTLITSRIVQSANRPLVVKLYQLGLLDSPYVKITAKDLATKVQEAQRLFSLMADGILRSTIIKELNVPLSTRLAALNQALNTIRWLRCIKEESGHIIVVNIPSASLLVYAQDTVTMESKVIVGKRSTRTPTLCSQVTEVVLYPYWMVPKKIATRELLPLIKKDIGYLDDNGFQVVNEKGKVVNPATINWQSLSISYFPYILRQSTGCDNSLGIVKVNFYNPYSVYLHDTPWKLLFNMNKRYFSHGCMRVEKAIELAHLILKNNTIAIDTLTEKGCLNNQRPIPVPASEKMPVFVLYNTAWVDSAATVRFYEDIYHRH